ncbi:hypothetical protein HUT06_39570 [Actinomadura sp. NAK00032]|uniref:hypothetical protein n=1 Tax=Actinomadura sp. NAK00032 TaxID=2742128 RepID=UPI0015910C94|nr:hypothetical protein [Actinomadura sp. NAK00032]QKW39383.1 hypothetical protein HUT06_39570 [Actinomadura sp. NAK00032]
MTNAYSYTTVQVEPDGSAAVHVSLHPDESVSVLAVTGHGRAQISVQHANASVLIAPTNAAAPTTGDLQIARHLAESFAVYAAEVERLHAENRAAEPAEDTAA